MSISTSFHSVRLIFRLDLGISKAIEYKSNIYIYVLNITILFVNAKRTFRDNKRSPYFNEKNKRYEVTEIIKMAYYMSPGASYVIHRNMR